MVPPLISFDQRTLVAPHLPVLVKFAQKTLAINLEKLAMTMEQSIFVGSDVPQVAVGSYGRV